jgi:hypothetical protein
MDKMTVDRLKLGFMHQEDPLKRMDHSPKEDLENNYREIEFQCTMQCLSIIRFITDHMEGLPAAIIHQLMEITDIPLILVPILEEKPWIRLNKKGEQEKYEDNRWSVIQPHEQGRVTKLEA